VYFTAHWGQQPKPCRIRVYVFMVLIQTGGHHGQLWPTHVDPHRFDHRGPCEARLVTPGGPGVVVMHKLKGTPSHSACILGNATAERVIMAGRGGGLVGDGFHSLSTGESASQWLAAGFNR
jgi:hypothetical protein